MMRVSAALAALALLGGCSSIVEGTSQTIAVNTNPAGAQCGLYREGMNIGTILQTPGATTVQKTKHDINVVCVMNGYQQATYFNKSGVAGATAANIILGGGIGWAIDSMSGADNKYDSPVNITMVPNPPGTIAAPAALPAAYNAAGPIAPAPVQAAPTAVLTDSIVR